MVEVFFFLLIFRILYLFFSMEFKVFPSINLNLFGYWWKYFKLPYSFLCKVYWSIFFWFTNNWYFDKIGDSLVTEECIIFMFISLFIFFYSFLGFIIWVPIIIFSLFFS